MGERRGHNHQFPGANGPGRQQGRSPTGQTEAGHHPPHPVRSCSADSAKAGDLMSSRARRWARAEGEASGFQNSERQYQKYRPSWLQGGKQGNEQVSRPAQQCTGREHGGTGDRGGRGGTRHCADAAGWKGGTQW